MQEEYQKIEKENPETITIAQEALARLKSEDGALINGIDDELTLNLIEYAKTRWPRASNKEILEWINSNKEFYQKVINDLEKVGDYSNHSGYLTGQWFPFFEKQGCVVENYDFARETHQVKRLRFPENN